MSIETNTLIIMSFRLNEGKVEHGNDCVNQCFHCTVKRLVHCGMIVIDMASNSGSQLAEVVLHFTQIH